MKNIFYEGQIIWAMIDFNGHLRHSAYADFGTQARSCAMEKFNIPQTLIPQKIGPILLREETKYFKELKFNESIKVSAEITKANTDFSRFTMKSLIYRAKDDKKCAEVEVDCAWLNIENRKFAIIPEDVISFLNQLPKSDDFTYL